MATESRHCPFALSRLGHNHMGNAMLNWMTGRSQGSHPVARGVARPAALTIRRVMTPGSYHARRWTCVIRRFNMCAVPGLSYRRPSSIERKRRRRDYLRAFSIFEKEAGSESEPFSDRNARKSYPYLNGIFPLQPFPPQWWQHDFDISTYDTVLRIDTHLSLGLQSTHPDRILQQLIV